MRASPSIHQWARTSAMIMWVILGLLGTWRAQGAVAQVHLVSPADGAVDVAPCVTLDWNAASGATGYEYEVMIGSTVVASGGSGGATSLAISLLESTTYRWRVRGKTSQNTGAYSAIWTFTTKPPIPAPGLSAPANGQSHTGLIVTFQWGQLADATAYDYEVYQNGGVVASGAVADSANPSVDVTLTEAAYTWRVRGKTSCRMGTWSGMWSFTIPPIPAPTQTSPANTATSVGLQPDIQWQSAAGATGYDFEVYLGASLVTSGSTANLLATIPAVLAENTTYTWRVRGKTSARNGLWSPSWSFTTKPPLAAPILLSPINNADGVGLAPTLNWQSVTDATAYDYEVLQNGVVIASGSGQPGLTVNLGAHGVYDWHVRAKTSLRTGSWSALWSFATHPPIAVPALIAPLNGETNVSLDVTLQWNSAAFATGYDYEVYSGPTLVASGSSNLVASMILSENTTYSWRVRGKTSQRIGQWSGFWTFETKPPILAPNLTSPVDNAANIGSNVTLNWQSLPDATGYNIQLLQSNVVVLTTNGSPGLIIHLPRSGVYGWRVQGKTSLRTGAWSVTWVFGTTDFFIGGQPASQTASPGTTVVLTVAPGGTGPFQYQWRRNGENITGATGPTFVIPNAQPIDSGIYSTVVIMGNRALDSDRATVKISSPALPLADNFANRGSATSLNQIGSGNNSGTTHEAFEPSHGGLPGARSVWMQWVAPANGLASFSTRGSSFDTVLAVYTGSNLASLAAVASDDDSDLFFTSKVLFPAVAGVAYAIAIDGFLDAQGDIVLTWNLDPNAVPTPGILQQPADVSAAAGTNVSFSVGAAATTPVSFQWYFGLSQPIAGATNASLTITNISTNNIGIYRVAVSAVGGATIFSRWATLELGSGNPSHDKWGDLIAAAVTVGFPSVSVGIPASRLINNFNSTTEEGEPIHSDVVGGSSRWYLLTAETNGMMAIDTIGSDIDTVLEVYPFRSDWYFNQLAADNNGAPDHIRSLVRFQAARTNTYLIRVDGVNNAQGRININWILGVAPSIAGSPSNQIVSPGGNLFLQAGDTNAVPPPAYQWSRNGIGISGATNAIFSLTNLQFDQVGDYSVVVSNPLGMGTNHIALVTMQSALRLAWDASNGISDLRVGGSSTQAVVLRFSTNLMLWTPVFTNTSPLLPVSFLDTNVTKRPKGFYQLKPWP